MDKNFEIYVGDALETLKKLEDESVYTCITSPPYYGLRDYGTGHWEGGDPNCKHFRDNKSKGSSTNHKVISDNGLGVGDGIYKKVCPLCGAVRVDEQIGLEETPDEYIEKLVEVFREVRRVLKQDGTLWLNIGDSYAGSGRGRNKDGSVNLSDKSSKQATSKGSIEGVLSPKAQVDWLKPKDLIGIPWMLAFALRQDGWYLRQDIIWHKPNPMPESVRDRCTKSHEYIFLLSKSHDYYFDHEAIQEVATGYDGRKDTMLKGSPKYIDDSYLPNQSGNTMAGSGHERWRFKNLQDKGQPTHTMHERRAEGYKDIMYPVRNKRDVWTVPVNNFKGAHFATFPEDLISPCILSGCPEGEIVLDPFSGSGTAGVVATRYNRKYIGIELNEDYANMSIERLKSANAKERLW